MALNIFKRLLRSSKMSQDNNYKQEFLKQLLEQYRHEDHGVNYLLKYILENDQLLKNVEFTKDVNHTPRGLYISYLLDGERSFVYFKDGLAYFHEEQAFHDLRLKQDESYFVEIVLPEKDLDDIYQNAMTDNPYLPGYVNYQEEITSYLEQVTHDVFINQIETEINEALESRDFSRLNELVMKLKRYKGEIE